MFEVFSLQTGEVVVDLRLKVLAPASHVEPDEFFALTKALHLTAAYSAVPYALTQNDEADRAKL